MSKNGHLLRAWRGARDVAEGLASVTLFLLQESNKMDIMMTLDLPKRKLRLGGLRPLSLSKDRAEAVGFLSVSQRKHRCLLPSSSTLSQLHKKPEYLTALRCVQGCPLQ